MSQYRLLIRCISNLIYGRQPVEVRRRITISRMRSAMQRARASRFPRVPATLEELTEILQDPRYRIITATEDAQDSLHAASVTDALGNHHVIFSSRRLLNVGKSLSILFLDGTFKTVPAIEELRNNDRCQVICALSESKLCMFSKCQMSHWNSKLNICFTDSCYCWKLGSYHNPNSLGPDVQPDPSSLWRSSASC